MRPSLIQNGGLSNYLLTIFLHQSKSELLFSLIQVGCISFELSKLNNLTGLRQRKVDVTLKRFLVKSNCERKPNHQQTLRTVLLE